MPRVLATRTVLAVEDLGCTREFGIRTPDGHRIQIGAPVGDA